MSLSYQSILDTMQQRYTQLSGVAPNDASDISIRLKVLAQQIYELYQSVDNVTKQTFPQTAEGDWLELHASQRGLTRKPKSFASGQVMFYRNNATSRAILIPKGVLLSAKTPNEARYETTKDVTLPTGSEEVLAPVQCVSPGISGNVAAGIITVMITPVPGIGNVNNPLPVSGATEQESDEELRLRLFDTYKQTTNGTNSSFYYNMACSYPGVSSANVIPRWNGVGTVKVVIHGDGVDANLVSRIAADMNATKELNVVVTVQKATLNAINIAVEILVEDGFNFDDVSNECKIKLQNLIKRQKVGATLYRSQIIKELVQCQGVQNCVVSGPSVDVSCSGTKIITLGSLSILEIIVFG